MSGFPRIPNLIGDTDDEASIHLHSRVGPGRPLVPKENRRARAEDEIIRILEEEDDDDEPASYNGGNAEGHTHDNDTENEFNRRFAIFQKTGRIDGMDSDADNSDAETRVDSSDGEDLQEESDAEEAEDYYSALYKDQDRVSRPPPKAKDSGKATNRKNKYKSSYKPNKGLFDSIRWTKEETGSDSAGLIVNSSKKNIILYGVISFLVTFVLLLIYERDTIFDTVGQSVLKERIYGINSRFKSLEYKIDELTRSTSEILAKKLLEDIPERHGEDATGLVSKKIEEVLQKFDEMNSKFVTNEEFASLDRKVLTLPQSGDHKEEVYQLEGYIDEITQKLNNLSQNYNTTDFIRGEIMKEMSAVVPKELHEMLKNTWGLFLQDNEGNLNAYIKQKIDRLGLKNSDLSLIEKRLIKRLNENNKRVWEAINNVIDRLNLNSTVNGSGERATYGTSNYVNTNDKVLLSNLLGTFAKGSVKVNYAEYVLGARILGFLTQTSISTDANGRIHSSNVPSDRSLARKVFLGWYDYLTSNGVSAPKEWKYNANNLLIDGGEYWQCKDKLCSVGIRLSSPVILTDLVIKTPHIHGGDSVALSENRYTDSGSKKSVLYPPSHVSVYVKPKSVQHAKVLAQYQVSRPDQDADELRETRKSPYLKKFFKVKEAVLEPSATINHIRLPVSLVNLKIPCLDIYIEFHADKSPTGAYNVQAYGVSELSSYKYSQDFDMLIDRLAQIEQAQYNDDEFRRSVRIPDYEEELLILGDD